MSNRRPVLITLLSLLLVAAVVVVAVLLVNNRNNGQPGTQPGTSPSTQLSQPPLSAITLKTSERSKLEIHGPTHVKGATIIDSTGKTVHINALVLMNYGTVNPRPPKLLTTRDYDNIASWGFNAVRLNFSWGHLEPNPPSGGTHNWDQRYLQALDTAVREFTKRHVAVIMDLYQYGWFPQMPLWLYPTRPPFYQAQCGFVTGQSEPGAPISPQDGAVDVWKMIMGRYADNPMVIGADLLNEPDCNTANSLDPLYSRLTGAIRSVNPKATIFFEDYVGGIIEQGHYGVSKPPDPNSVYSFHLYRPGWSKAKELLDKYVSNGKKLTTPMWLGEFDAFGSNRVDKPPQADWQQNTDRLFTYLKDHDASGWAYWAYQGLGSVFLPDRQTVNTGIVSLLQKGFNA